jgi:2-dehydro-3-deoxygluconokinase
VSVQSAAAEPVAPSLLQPWPALDVVTYGEAMALLIAGQAGPLAGATQFEKRLAGAETNVAIGLSRLGLKVGWVSRLGADSFGDFIRASIMREHVDCSQVTSDALHTTGMMLKARAQPGHDPEIEYFRRGSAASHLSVADFDPAYFGSARHLHTTGIAPALSASTLAFATHALEWMRAQGKTISFDPNLRPTLWSSESVMRERINRLAAYANWVLPGLNEGRILTGYTSPADIAAFYLERGAQLVVIKCGAQGAYYRTPDTEGGLPAIAVAQVVDTVGAGDGFAVGVISALLEGLAPEAAVARGNLIGAQAVQVLGDMEGLPTRQGLLALIASLEQV